MELGDTHIEQAAAAGRSPEPSAPRGCSCRAFLWPLLLIAGGILTLSVLDALESRRQSTQMWRDALSSLDGPPPWEQTLPLKARMLPLEQTPGYALIEELRSTAEGRSIIDTLHLELREAVLALSLPPETWESILESGRVPELGQREVLAGPLCRLDTVVLDGETFRVAGRLQRGASGLALAYLLPQHENFIAHFAPEAGATEGWLDPVGVRRVRDDEALAQSLKGLKELRGGISLTGTGTARLSILAIAAVLCGGAMFQWRVFQDWATKLAPFRPVCEAMGRHRRLFWGLNALNFGLFLGLMSAALIAPIWHLRAMSLFVEAFTEGSLSHIGDAYLSGNVLWAAWETFRQNFVLQTLLLAVLPSLAIPFWGAAKNALSIAVVGFGVAPLYTGTAGSFTYHGITVVLELEAYTIASFVVCLYPLYLLHVARESRPRAMQTLGHALRVLGSGVLLSGAILATAALFEALTLT